MNLEVPHLVEAGTLTRAPHHEDSSVAVVVKPLRSGAKEEVGLLAETGTGLVKPGLNEEDKVRELTWTEGVTSFTLPLVGLILRKEPSLFLLSTKTNPSVVCLTARSSTIQQWTPVV